MGIAPKAIQDLLDELEASRATRKRACTSAQNYFDNLTDDSDVKKLERSHDK